MTRLVVHIGSQRVATMSIPRGLFTNLDVLSEAGVLVPKTGRNDLSPLAVRHHLLAWSFDPQGDHPHDPDVWEKLAEEIRSSPAHTVLLSSELLAGVAADETTAGRLQERLRALSDDVTVAFVARDPLGLLNGLYCQRVRALELTCDFETYLAESPDLALCRLADSFRPWYDGSDLRFVAMPWDSQPDAEALPALLALCDIKVRAKDLLPTPNTERADLGPVGVEATRLLGAYLRGRFPDFRHGEPAARRLRRRAASLADEYSWSNGDFWGWAPAQAAEALAGFAPSNEEFARRTWGGEWTITSPGGRERNVAELVEMSSTAVNRVHHYLIEMAASFDRLRVKEAEALAEAEALEAAESLEETEPHGEAEPSAEDRLGSGVVEGVAE